MSANRASFQVTGPLLARYRTVSTPPPGGDPIGGRPVDVHINGQGQTDQDKRSCNTSYNSIFHFNVF